MKTHHTETDVLRLTASFSVALLHSAAARMSGMEPAADGDGQRRSPAGPA